MRKVEIKNILFALPLLLLTHCKKPFDPVVLTKSDNYLVVDGFINTTPGGVTNIVLSRTKNLTDTVVSIPERNAGMAIQSAAGNNYPLQETGTAGSYTSNVLTLDKNDRYKIVIATANGNQYQSDFIAARQTPAIDSITWNQDSKGVNLYVSLALIS